MRKLAVTVLGGALLALGGCVTTVPSSRIVYGLDGNGDLTSHMQTTTTEKPDPLGTGLLFAAGILGVYFLYEVYDRSTDNGKTTVVNTPAPNNGLVPTGGSWQTDFIQPIYTPVGFPDPDPIIVPVL